MVDTAFLVILTTLFFSNTMYGLASPFLPDFFEKRHVNQEWTGIIFASYAVAVTFSAIISGKLLGKSGHKYFTGSGAMLMALSIAGFGLIEYEEKNNVVIIISIVLRLFQGKTSLSFADSFAFYRMGLWYDEHCSLFLRLSSLP